MIYIPKKPNDSNHEYQGMVFPVRPFVQLIMPDPDNTSEYLDVFNVPYDYFVDMAVNATTTEGFSGRLQVVNPWPMSDADEKRFKKFDDAMRAMVRLTYANETAYIDRLSSFDVAMRWGWCDNENNYFCSTWNRFRISNINLSVAEQGVAYRLDIMNPAFQGCTRIRIDRDITAEGAKGSPDLLESTADLFAKYHVILDFPNEEPWKDYRIFKYDEKTDAVIWLSDGVPLHDPESRKRRRNDFRNNAFADNAYNFPSSGKLSDILSGVLRAVCRSEDYLRPNPMTCKRLGVYYDSQVEQWFTNTIDSKLKSDLTDADLQAIRDPDKVGFVTIKRDMSKLYPRIYLRMDHVMYNSPQNHDDVYKSFRTSGLLPMTSGGGAILMEERHYNSPSYTTMLNSRDCGLYRYYAGSGSVDEGGDFNVKETQTDLVRQSNISALGVDIATWLFTYVGDPTNVQTILENNGTFAQTGNGNSPSTPTFSHPNVNPAKSNAQMLPCLRQISNVHLGNITDRIARGTIDILGDPSISQGVFNIRKYIHIMVYTPNGKPLPYWSGLYSVLGYSHNVSEGRYTTTLELLSIPFDELPPQPVQKPVAPPNTTPIRPPNTQPLPIIGPITIEPGGPDIIGSPWIKREDEVPTILGPVLGGWNENQSNGSNVV